MTTTLPRSSSSATPGRFGRRAPLVALAGPLPVSKRTTEVLLMRSRKQRAEVGVGRHDYALLRTRAVEDLCVCGT